MKNKEAIAQLRCNVEGDYINLDDLEAFAVAIQALEKQIPKKPLARDLWELGTAIGSSCPTCGYDFPIGNYRRYEYCPECGQALDWSGHSTKKGGAE